MLKKSVDKDIKDLLKFLLKFRKKERPSIEEVLKHKAFVNKKGTFYDPISEHDYKLLIKYFMINSDNGRGRTLPDVVVKA